VAFTVIVTGSTSDDQTIAQPKNQLVVATSRQIAVATLEGGSFRFDTSIGAGLGTLRAVTGLDAADVDGDGVQDLAIAQSGAIRILRQRPRVQ
jgi:hypothetical protein